MTMRERKDPMPRHNDTVTNQVFSTENYATGLGQRLRRGFELGPKYYIADVPRYLNRRRKLGLPILDTGILWNPFRSFVHRTYVSLSLPPYYQQALMELEAAGVRLDNPPPRIEALVGLWWQGVQQGVPGEVIECGAYRGATSLLLAVLGKFGQVDQKILMLDTFSGMPAPSQHDMARSSGEYKPPADWIETIDKQIERLAVRDRVELHQGLFSDTFENLGPRPLSFSFAHIDANIYQGTLEACEFTMPRMSSGGSVVFDDYNGLLDLGARLAIDSALAGRTLRPRPLAECSAYLTI
jgi:hypothetical protein